ncbi:MAG: hypothetical protein ABI776_13265 [Nocardioidaceae bacterium]
MFDTIWIADLDTASACEAVIATQEELREREWQEIALAAHWVTLHDPASLSLRDGPVLPGTERAKRAGGDGTPEVSEFACAELGALMGVGFISADSLMRDAVDLQHRHPRMWAALSRGEARVWKARQVAHKVHAADLSREQALFVDAVTADYVDTLTWSAYVRLVEAKIIEADPEAAEERRLAAELERFVATGVSNEHGLKTLVARATAGEVIYFVAMCDRIAQILALEGDTGPVGLRRSKALAILANPARALDLLQRHATDAAHPDDPDPEPDLATALVQDVSTLCTACGGPRIDPERMRPRAVLHVRISEASLVSRTGTAACEGVGPVTAAQVADLLGHHHVTVRPVLDLRDQVPVTAYEVPAEMAEAISMWRLPSVFPWSHTESPRVDLDHNRPYVPPERGGRAGQTRIGNLGPMVRFGHRVKTHGRGWQMRQPQPGVYLFRTPHGYWFRVDHDGSHPLGRDPDLSAYEHAPPRTPLDHALVRLTASVC